MIGRRDVLTLLPATLFGARQASAQAEAPFAQITDAQVATTMLAQAKAQSPQDATLVRLAQAAVKNPSKDTIIAVQIHRSRSGPLGRSAPTAEEFAKLPAAKRTELGNQLYSLAKALTVSQMLSDKFLEDYRLILENVR